MIIAESIGVVTGAAGGIGRALCFELARRKMRGLAMVDASESVADAANQLNREMGTPVARPFVGDVTNNAFRREVYRVMQAELGVVRVCVPAAGIVRDRLAVKVDGQAPGMGIYPPDQFRQVLEVNLIAPVYWALEMIAGVAEERRRNGLSRWDPREPLQGAIVFLGSVSSLGNKGQIAYASAKAGLEGAAATLRLEAIYYGVRCGVVHPGYTDTPMVRALGENRIRDAILPNTQLRRLIQPEEIAEAVAFMIGNAAVSGPLWADAGWRPSA